MILIIILCVLFLMTIYLVINHDDKKDCTNWVKRKTKTLSASKYQKIKF